jgi:hypothetical protein
MFGFLMSRHGLFVGINLIEKKPAGVIMAAAQIKTYIPRFLPGGPVINSGGFNKLILVPGIYGNINGIYNHDYPHFLLFYQPRPGSSQ